MEAVGRAKNYTEMPVWRHGTSAFQFITDYFLPALEGLGIRVGDLRQLSKAFRKTYARGELIAG
jgi:DNA helicase II / ATP-dependent DNA helicase PcrA